LTVTRSTSAVRLAWMLAAQPGSQVPDVPRGGGPRSAPAGRVDPVYVMTGSRAPRSSRGWRGHPPDCSSGCRPGERPRSGYERRPRRGGSTCLRGVEVMAIPDQVTATALGADLVAEVPLPRRRHRQDWSARPRPSVSRRRTSPS
jgi:hypothetical protein